MSTEPQQETLPSTAGASSRGNVRNLVRELMEARQDWIEHLQEAYKIKVSRSECGRLVSLKYNQIESPMRETIVAQCRGMVVDTSRNQVVAWPYDKFWNLGEPLADELDWSTAIVQEKLDGSLMIVYFDPGLDDWRVASSGHPTAGGSFGNDSSRTFAQAFWAAWSELGMEKPDDRSRCYLFELCAMENRVVVQHARTRIVLHGVRAHDGGELSHAAAGEVAARLRWEHVRVFPVTNASEALSAAAELDALQTEGFVVVDRHGRRLKIKSPRYVALHHLKGEATPRRAIELWQTGETGELLLTFPEMADTITPVQARLDAAVDEALAETQRLLAIPELTQKDFALAVKDQPWSAIAFSLKRDGVTTREAAARLTRGMTLPSLERLNETLEKREAKAAAAQATPAQ